MSALGVVVPFKGVCLVQATCHHVAVSPQKGIDMTTLAPSSPASTTAPRPATAAASHPPRACRAEEELSRGTRLGAYTVEELIHSRGEIAIYSAWNPESNRVALKVLTGTGARSSRRLRGFYVSAKLAMLTNHPRLIPVLSVGECSGRHFQVLPLFEQQTLLQHLWGQRPLTEPAAWRMALGLAEGLELLHRAGFIHRDVSTENIFLHDSLGWVLGGFGRVLDRTAEEDQTTVPGDPHWHPFQAPELLLGPSRHTLPACDVYSLAAVMAKCLLGSIPFETRSRDECLVLKRQQSSLWLSEHEGAMSRETARFLARCLDPDPTRRPSSLVEFLQCGARVLGQPAESLWPRLARLTTGTTDGTWHAWRVQKSGRHLQPIPQGQAEYFILRGQWGPRTMVSCNPQGPFLPVGEIPEFRPLLELAVV